MEFFLFVVVVLLLWSAGQARRRERQLQQAAQALIDEAATPHPLRGTLVAETDGYAYWLDGDTLMRAPVGPGAQGGRRAEPADPACCADLTEGDVDEIVAALERAADDLLHGRLPQEP